MSEPIMRFKTQGELNRCLEEWKNRLFLTSWNIKAYLVPGEEIPERGGESDVQWVNSSGIIKIRVSSDMPEGAIGKQPHELILIHELLHFCYMTVENNSSIEAVYYTEKQHQLLERMAKSLLMAKYGIDYTWFFE